MTKSDELGKEAQNGECVIKTLFLTPCSPGSFQPDGGSLERKASTSNHSCCSLRSFSLLLRPRPPFLLLYSSTLPFQVTGDLPLTNARVRLFGVCTLFCSSFFLRHLSLVFILLSVSLHSLPLKAISSMKCAQPPVQATTEKLASSTRKI